MPDYRHIKEAELQALAEKYPDRVGSYDAEKQELTTPDGEVLKLDTYRLGKSEAVFVKGAVKQHLTDLDLGEIKKPVQAASAGNSVSSISLSEVPERQVKSKASWRAWFKRNIYAKPEDITKAVDEGYKGAKPDIEKALEEEKEAQREAQEAEARKALKNLKKSISPERLKEMIDEAS